MTDRPRGLVLGWMPTSQRSATLAARLGFELAIRARAGDRRRWTAPFAYVALAVWTVRTLVARRPRALIVVAPPFVTPVVAVPVARLLGARIAVDIHSGALLDRRWRWSVPILAAVSRLAGLAIVTLPSLAARLDRSGVSAHVLPDPLPALRPSSAGTPAATAVGAAAAKPRVVVVCGWGDDEPLDELAAAATGRSWQLLVTGRPRRAVAWPSNATTTGYLDGPAYVDLLAGADLVVVLTRRDETLLSGAWEALALERPLLVSATPALVATFGPELAALPDRPGGLGETIDAALADPAALAASARDAARRFRAANDAALATLASRLGVDPPPDPAA